jgi:hypothetical protein
MSFIIDVHCIVVRNTANLRQRLDRGCSHALLQATKTPRNRARLKRSNHSSSSSSRSRSRSIMRAS